MFEGVNWLGVGLGAIASFVVGWLWYSPRMFYKVWSEASGITHSPEDKMGAAFGSLVIGLILYATFVGMMMARGQTAVLVFGIVTFIIMGYSNSAFKKLGAGARTVDAGSWAASGCLMILAQWLVGG